MSKELVGFSLDWQYHKGDLPDGLVLNSDKEYFEDWAYVNIPHCTRYVTPDKFHAYEGISWYRKEFELLEEFKNKKLFVQFDAVMQQADVYLNGTKLTTHLGGYMGFVVELNGAVNMDGKNVLVVKSDSNGKPDFAPTANKGIDFQYHGGMYRPVHLYATEDVYITNELLEDEIAGGGVFVTNKELNVEAKSATVSVKVHVRNSGAQMFSGAVKATIAQSEKVCDIVAVSEYPVSISADSADYVELTLNIPENVNFWSIDNPYLYVVNIELYDNNDVLLDEKSLKYGIRSIDWKKDGLYINGERQTSLHGVNYHQDIFGVGNAMTKELIYEDVHLIKDAGLKFIRCSHYPHSPYFYEACDEMGLVCLNSITGWQVFVNSEAFTKNTIFELRQMIRRDRNHACVVAWESSINEAGFTHEWGQLAHDAAHEEYPGCFTAAWKNGGDGAYPDIYLCAAQHGSKVYAAKTKKPVIISEYGDWNFGGTKSTSRQERGDGDVAMLSHCNNLEESFADNEMQMQNEEVVADAYWDFTDYSPFSSEPTVIKCGLVDMYRIPKHGYYFYKSQNSEPMVYIANQWTSDSPFDVRIYSNCEEVELYLNGASLGKNKPAKSNITNNSRQETGLTYEDTREYSYETLAHPPFFFKLDSFVSGSLKAVGYIDGKAVAEHEVKTPGEAVSISFERADERALTGDGVDQTIIYAKLVDANGTLVGHNGTEIRINVTGAAKLVGPDTVYTVGGIATFVVRASRSGEGEAVVEAKADGIKGSLTIAVTACDIYGKEPQNFSWWEIPEDKEEVLADVAREKKAFASSCASDSQPWYGNSGNPGLWWSAAKNAPGEWWMVDLEDVHTIDSVNIVWPKSHAYQYILEASMTGEADGEWTLLCDRSKADKAIINTNDEVSGRGRYVRITIVGNVDDVNTVTFNMFSVYGKRIG